MAVGTSGILCAGNKHVKTRMARILLGGAVMAGLLFCVSDDATAFLINTYTGPGTGPGTNFTANITVGASSTWTNGGYSTDGLVSGFGFTGPAGAFTDSDVDGFPEHTTGGGPDNIWVTDFLPADGSTVNLQWLSFSFPDSFSLASMRLWNKNQWGDGTDDDGVKDAYLWYSNDASLPGISSSIGGASPGAGWTKVPGGLRTFSISTGGGAYDGESVALGGVTARHFLIDIESRNGNVAGGGAFVGMSAVQFLGFNAVIVESMSVVTDAAGVSFDSISNATHRLQSTPDLVSSNFSDTGAFTIGNGASMTLFDPTGPSTSKNYRVVVLQE